MRKTVVIMGVIVAGGASPDSASAQSWEADFPAAPACRIAMSLDTRSSNAVATGPGTLVVRPVQFEDARPVPYTRATLTAIGDAPQQQWRVGFERMDSSGVREFRGIPSGRYLLWIGTIGYDTRKDTVTIRAGAVDTVTVAMEMFHDGYRNVHNCRPRGFRRPGESACVTAPRLVEGELNYARRLASPDEERIFPEIPSVASSEIALVTDEDVCERAGRAYGGPDDPPRRVVVVRLGQLFMVYDPFEPQAAGEWNIRSIFDRNWTAVVHLAG